MQAPVACRDAPACHVHPTLPGLLGAALIRHQIVPVGEAREKPLRASSGVGKPLHGAALPLHGGMGLVSQGPGRRHLRGCEHRIPAGVLGLDPAPDALAMHRCCRGGDMRGTVPPPWAQRKHAPALPPSRLGPEGVALRTAGLTNRGRHRRPLLRERAERVAQAAAEACPRHQGPQTLRGAVKPIGEHPAAPLRRLLRGGRTLALWIRLGNSRRPGASAHAHRQAWGDTPAR